MQTGQFDVDVRPPGRSDDLFQRHPVGALFGHRIAHVVADEGRVGKLLGQAAQCRLELHRQVDADDLVQAGSGAEERLSTV